jgi:hypothetical protein
MLDIYKGVPQGTILHTVFQCLYQCFAGFACILFDENHEISDLLSTIRDFVTVAKEVPDIETVLSSA